jgi:1,4-alpha-glucan branching enzyme
MIFQGQEFLEDEWFHDQDPIDWPKKETYRAILHMYRDLIRLRRNWYDNTRGLRGQHVHVQPVLPLALPQIGFVWLCFDSLAGRGFSS